MHTTLGQHATSTNVIYENLHNLQGFYEDRKRHLYNFILSCFLLFVFWFNSAVENRIMGWKESVIPSLQKTEIIFQ